MKFTRLLYIMVITVMVIPFPRVSHALDLTFRPRLESGMEYYKFKIDNVFRITGQGSSVSASQVEMEDWMPIISGGFTVVANRFYVDLSGLKAFNGEDDIKRNSSTSFPGGTAIGKVKGDGDFDRWEYSLSLGYLVTDNLSVFAGYRESKTDLKFNSSVSTQEGDFLGTTKIKSDFEQDGPFIGASYGWHINKSVFKGVLSGSIAFAALDGDFKINSVSGDFTKDQLPDDSSSGDTTGMKVGFAWTGATPVERLNYTLGVDGYKYEFDANGDDPDVNETVINLKVGLAYTF